MSEMAKTVTFVGIALVLAAVAFVTRSGSIATAPRRTNRSAIRCFPNSPILWPPKACASFAMTKILVRSKSWK